MTSVSSSSKESISTQISSSISESQDCSMPVDSVSDPSQKFADDVEYPSQLPNLKESS